MQPFLHDKHALRKLFNTFWNKIIQWQKKNFKTSYVNGKCREDRFKDICLHTHSRLVFLPTFTCLMLHKSHLNIFFIRLKRPESQQLRNKSQFRWSIHKITACTATDHTLGSTTRLCLLFWWFCYVLSSNHSTCRKHFFPFHLTCTLVLRQTGRLQSLKSRGAALLVPYLHCDVRGPGRVTLQAFVPAAACATHQWNAGRGVDVLHLRRVLVHHLHQLLDSPAEAAIPHFLEHQHCAGESESRLGRGWKAIMML